MFFIAAPCNDMRIILGHNLPDGKKIKGQNKIFRIMDGAKTKIVM